MKLTILIHCADQPGIISSVTRFIHKKKGNIIYLDQHVDKEAGVFFMRLESEFEQGIDVPGFKSDFDGELANNYQMQWGIYEDGIKPKMAIFCFQIQPLFI